ncbi:MAG TPA: hypothetical protein VK476_03110, partial [Flavobacterium sp.]|nr:hypothetical protein [Flavobacterium sp.]
MKKLLLLMVFVLSFAQLSAQRTSTWKKVSDHVQDSEKIRTTSYSERQQLFQVNLVELRQVLANAADKFSGQPGVSVEFPNSNGELEEFLVWENSNFEPALQAQ